MAFWEITAEGTARILSHRTFGKFYQSKSDGLWWSEDRTGHGGSVWKVFRETAVGLEWIADADQFGTFVVARHKGPTGLLIPWSELGG